MAASCNTIEYNDLGGVNGFGPNDEIIIVINGQPRRMTVATFLSNLVTADTNLVNTDLTLLQNRIHQLENFILSFVGPGKVIIGAEDGTSKLTVTEGDIEASTPGKGVITSDDTDTRWRQNVNSDGIIVVETT